MIRAVLATLLASATSAVADAPFLGMPVDCVLGETCVIQEYPDVDAGDGASDYRCGLKSSDGHSGTDFALLTFEQMQKGVRVIAAADGRVEAMRDRLPDQPYVPGTDLNGQECGNAVRIDHGNGYQTVYCHMKLGSVIVSPGQRVLSGQVLGEVGLSGLTAYPHLHLTVTQGADVIDPFAPDQANDCNRSSASLWIDTPEYSDGGLFTAGISDAVPDMDGVQSGRARRGILGAGDSLVLYGHAFRGKSGDALDLVLTGPEGEVFRHTARLEDAQAQFFRAFGRRAPAAGWPKGAYRGYVQFKRNRTILSIRHAEVTVE